MPFSYLNAFLHLFYPHNCEGCGSDILPESRLLCARCIHELPETGFFDREANPVEKLFYGRMDVRQAAASFYFTKQSLLQHLMVQLKYRNNREAGYFFGRMMGRAMSASGRFDSVDALVPLPLNEKKQKLRGYNQAELICMGITEVWSKPLLRGVVARTRFTETQTHQGRISRWQNMEGVFALDQDHSLGGKHVLLVDDVITTGATLEACGMALQRAGVTLSIAAAAYTLL